MHNKKDIDFGHYVLSRIKLALIKEIDQEKYLCTKKIILSMIKNA